MQDQDSGNKTEKTWKMVHKHCMTWKPREVLKNLKNEKCSQQDLQYGEKPVTSGKRQTRNVGP